MQKKNKTKQNDVVVNMILKKIAINQTRSFQQRYE